MGDEGIHRIGFTRQHETMSPDERDKWIDILKKNISLQNLDQVSETNHTLSLAYNYDTLFELDSFFNDWEITQSESLNSRMEEADREDRCIQTYLNFVDFSPKDKNIFIDRYIGP